MAADDIFATWGQFNSFAEYNTAGQTINSDILAPQPGPYSTGVVASGGDLFVTSYGQFDSADNDWFEYGSVGEYTTSGAVANSSLVTGLTGATAIAASGNNLWVAYQNIQSGSLGSGVEEFTTAGALVGHLNLPAGLEYNSNPLNSIAVSGGDVFVTSPGYGIAEFTTSGALLNTWSPPNSGDTLGGIAVSGSDLFVANGGVVSEYTASGTLVDASFITVPGLFAQAVTVSAGDLFVLYIATGGNTSSIGEYTTSGAPVNASLVTGLPEAGSNPLTSFEESIAVVPTPEPSSWALLAIGGAALVAFRRHPRRRPVTTDRPFSVSELVSEGSA